VTPLCSGARLCRAWNLRASALSEPSSFQEGTPHKRGLGEDRHYGLALPALRRSSTGTHAPAGASVLADIRPRGRERGIQLLAVGVATHMHGGSKTRNGYIYQRRHRRGIPLTLPLSATTSPSSVSGDYGFTGEAYGFRCRDGLRVAVLRVRTGYCFVFTRSFGSGFVAKIACVCARSCSRPG